jgi:hypothetical protein
MKPTAKLPCFLANAPQTDRTHSANGDRQAGSHLYSVKSAERHCHSQKKSGSSFRISLNRRSASVIVVIAAVSLMEIEDKFKHLSILK